MGDEFAQLNSESFSQYISRGSGFSLIPNEALCREIDQCSGSKAWSQGEIGISPLNARD